MILSFSFLQFPFVVVVVAQPEFFLLDFFSTSSFPATDSYHIPDFLFALASKCAVYLLTMMNYFDALNTPLSASLNVTASTGLALMPLVSSYCHLYEFVLKKHRKLPYASGNRKKYMTLVNTDMILHPDKVCKDALGKKL